MPIETFREYNGEKGYFGKAFVIDADLNGNGWRIARACLKKRMQEWKGKPMLEYWQGGNMTHPKHDTYEQAIVEQEEYNQGVIRDVGFDKRSENYWIVFKTNERIFNKIKNNEIQYVSPSLFPIEWSREFPPTALDAKPTHVAFVSVPAYGNQAKIVGICSGTTARCKAELKQIVADLDNNISHVRDIKLIAARLKLLDASVKLSQLQANRDDPRHWVTIRGAKVYIKDGQTKSQAIKEFIDKKEGKTKSKPTKSKPTKTKPTKEKPTKEKKETKEKPKKEVKPKKEKAKPKKDKAKQTRFQLNDFDADMTLVDENVSKKQQSEIQATLDRTPEKLLKNIEYMIFQNPEDSSSGYFSPGDGVVSVTPGAGTAYVVQHEIHHSVFRTQRSPEQLDAWKEAMDEIYEEEGLAVTDYAGQHHPQESGDFSDVSEKTKERIEMVESAIEDEDYSMDAVFYVEYSEIADEYDPSHPKRDEAFKEIRETYKIMSEDDKLSHLEDTLERLTTSGISQAKSDHIFYNESHSEVAAFIYEEKSHREWAGESAEINNSAMGKAVKKYKEIFADDFD